MVEWEELGRNSAVAVTVQWYIWCSCLVYEGFGYNGYHGSIM